MTPKKKKILIISIIAIILVLLSIGGYFIYKEIKFKQPIKEDWGQKYYVHLKKDDTIPEKSKNI